ncbi:MAG: DNA polymerase domain-containing protein [Peptococcaceae bacterium]|nr:DNA polymerase domain-containing protein [Peptococcaceae bacterium]
MPKINIDGRVVELSNLDKKLWAEGITKADLINYYYKVAPYALAYLKDRPAVMNRFPNGIDKENFYQKECPAYAPEWIATVAIEHSDAEKVVRYIVYRDAATLVWLANQAAIEMHAWLSRVEHISYPDIGVLDLDPAEGAEFEKVREVALLARAALREFGLDGFPKTSGATGIHIFIPLRPVYTFSEVTKALKIIAGFVVKVCPYGTVERKIENRKGKVYVDYLQNTRGKTMAFPYSVRPLPGAPVSMPLSWEEVNDASLRPGDFTIKTTLSRLHRVGDLYAGFFDRRYDLKPLLEMDV